MVSQTDVAKNGQRFGIWFFAFGYFACYVPYSYLAKVTTTDLSGDPSESLSGPALLPISVLASLVGMFLVFSGLRWWRYATQWHALGMSLPRPTRYTFLSGVCTAGVIATTTLAYSFQNVSIVLAMLLMRGGVLIIAPVVDRLSGRTVAWYSWAGLGMTFAALGWALSDLDGYSISVACGINIAIYLASYFVRFRFMSKLAKSDNADVNMRYFVEEQMVATPALVVMLAIAASCGCGTFCEQLRIGFTAVWSSENLPWVIAIGLFSQGTGFFGSLIYLDRRENTYCVPVNRCSSVLAGVLASIWLALAWAEPLPAAPQLAGAAMIIGAILFLTVPPFLARRRS